MKMKKFVTASAGLLMAFALTACGGGGAGTATTPAASGDATASASAPMEEGGSVGVSMPTQTSERWIADGEAVKSQLEEAGFEVDLQFANDDIPTQGQQIDQMITQGVKVLIIAAIDGTALAPQLENAAAQGIKIISYDRLIRDSANVDFYVSFDNFKVGVAQGQALIDGLKARGEGPFNIELFAGSLDDNNAFFFFDGAMSVIQPEIDNGTMVVVSGQTDIEQAATLRWQQETAQKRMEDLLTANYQGDTKVDGVLSAYDGLSRGIITALQNNGYSGTVADSFPIVTGQDAEIASVKLIQDGIQSSTIFKDTRLLAEQAVTAAQDLLAGNEPEANNTEDYDNGVKVVPSYLLDVVTVTSENITEALVDTGYWTQEQIDAGVA
ncbi:sugar-binding protein [Tessaracoccus sp. MC1679]|uniref:multiple monosaccharide ABC transporter substrate-binding protein n=2 Tax=unclassified Tessaracoccus TaxID=2635419 RepID=UPI0016030BC7|nr:multiple monosaccharide ABC transporter substrate-binding protein [Tessaracoccus sp. MC1679]MBB1513624.1 sugar-binding protein [Tessaracoccus sp. MC1627]MBB1517230.1 sugar-binding protein [Tessaracoccus sp. MC1679]